jgi:hypothetical protein
LLPEAMETLRKCVSLISYSAIKILIIALEPRSHNR